MTSSNPVFVVGIFRSGTSLLCSILNQNPKIALMYECDVWNFPSPLLKRRFKQNWAERIAVDVEYVDNWSMRRDLRIMLGRFAVDVDENFRVTFRFDGTDAVEVDYGDYH